MWIIHKLINFIPTEYLYYISNIIIFIGVFVLALSLTVKDTKFSIWVKRALILVGSIIFTLGFFVNGYTTAHDEWEHKVDEIKRLERESAEANIQIKERIVTKLKVIKDTQVVVKEKIKIQKVEIDKQCVVTPQAIDILNEAAKSTIK